MSGVQASLTTDNGAAAAAAALGTVLERCTSILDTLGKMDKQNGRRLLNLHTIEQKLLYPIEYDKDNATEFSNDLIKLIDECERPSEAAIKKLASLRSAFVTNFGKLKLTADQGAAAAMPHSNAAGKKRKLN